jgi:hypothetical protein
MKEGDSPQLFGTQNQINLAIVIVNLKLFSITPLLHSVDCYHADFQSLNRVIQSYLEIPSGRV